MALANFDAFKATLTSPKEMRGLTVPAATVVAGRLFDLWTLAVPAGAAPTTAAVPTSATTGALGQQDGGAGALGLTGMSMSAMSVGTYLLIDRLSHQGGLNATVTGAVTTNLPTSALTRYTSGAGVMLGITIYTQIGSTATTISCSYTNDAGTSGRTSPTIAIGGTGFREAGRMLLVPLAAGDTGVRSVESSTLTATTGTAGAFGYTLFRPLAAIMVDEANGVAVADLVTGKWGGGLPEIVDGACLSLLCISSSVDARAAGSVLLSEW